MINERYFEWLCDHIIDKDVGTRYDKLFNILHRITFEPLMPMDENRVEDGKNLRYRFGRDNDMPSSVISQELDCVGNILYNRCTILEMMIALAIRCEETIMTDDEHGDRTGLWFWNMINSLGLSSMNDKRFDEKYVRIVLERFSRREYDFNGCGGLFTINGVRKDMRRVEIWYQMCWYLDTIIY